jgi:hypothetical protein
MDLKVYYQKIRELEQSFTGAYPVVVSEETPEGGVAGVKTEVPAHIAARMIVEGQARMSTEPEAKDFLDLKAETKRTADEIEASKRMQVTVVSESDLRPRRSSKPTVKS